MLSIFLACLSLAAAQSPIICEDSISAQPPFNNNDIPCLLGCGSQIAQATGSLLPGSVNVTEIPYCRLNCVRDDATPAQSSAAPDCNAQCENGNAATPDQLGWCMYWCVDGVEEVVSTTCVPQLEYVPVKTSTLETNLIVTIEGFTTPAAWASWYATQTVFSRSSLIAVAPTPTMSTTSGTQGTRAELFPLTSTSSPTTSAMSLGSAQAESSSPQAGSTLTSTTSGAARLMCSRMVSSIFTALFAWLILYMQ